MSRPLETIRAIKDTIILDNSKQIVAFMQQLKEYELLTTTLNKNTNLPEIIPFGSHRIHKPFIDTTVQLNEIREFCWVLGLDIHLHAVYIDLLTIGNVHRSLVPIDEVYRGIATYAASSIIVVHNHPSGFAVPSTSDIRLTKRILQLGQMLERPLLDHIIMGHGDQHYSFTNDRKEGLHHLQKVLKDEELAPKRLLRTTNKLIKAEKRNEKLEDKLVKKDKEIEKQAQEIEELKLKLEQELASKQQR